MKTIVLDLANVDYSLNKSELPACVLTIGNFDGIHLGHQAMLNQLKNTAATANIKTMVMVFEPQPREYFAQLQGKPEAAPARLTSQSEKLALLAQHGIDVAVVATFNESFRSLSATAFADMLVHKLNIKSLVLGDDFRFGNDRTGDSEFLRNYGLPVTNLHTITDTHVHESSSNAKLDIAPNPLADQDNRISSTRIRELLDSGNLATANRLLGRDYGMQGVVIDGDKIGRTLDFPTANIELNRVQPALHGVYGVDVVILDESGQILINAFTDIVEDNKQGIRGLRPHSLFGTANIGIRPSVNKPHDWRLEVFFPEFSGNLYGKTLEVRFLHYLHAERKYEGLEALKVGIKQDVQDLVSWRRQHQN